MSTCPKCGAEITEAYVCGATQPVSPKSRLVAAILAWYLGVFGVHRFYAGRIVSGIFMILTFGGLGIWALPARPFLRPDFGGRQHFGD